MYVSILLIMCVRWIKIKFGEWCSQRARLIILYTKQNGIHILVRSTQGNVSSTSRGLR